MSRRHATPTTNLQFVPHQQALSVVSDLIALMFDSRHLSYSTLMMTDLW
jgi:hypothetical protein